MTKSNSPLISVIIPVYNVEKYLEQCLKSVINQSYKNLEIICVNDSSTDNSLSILKKYANIDSRIKIIENTANLGLGLSRNEGIKAASGDYIHCLDSDDWLDLSAYEKLVEYIKKAGEVDAIRFTYYSRNEQTGEVQHITYSSQKFFYQKVNMYNTPECVRFWTSSAWIKLLRRDFIIENNLFYNDYRCLEDILYSIQALLKAKSIYFVEDSLLCYRAQRKGSLLDKRLYYIDNIIKDTEWTNQNTQNLELPQKIALRNYMYEFLVLNSLDAYYAGILTYNKLRETYHTYIDFESFKENEYFNIPYCYKMAEKVLSYNKIKFFFSYNARRYLKEKFPKSAEFYFKIKSKILRRS